MLFTDKLRMSQRQHLRKQHPKDSGVASKGAWDLRRNIEQGGEKTATGAESKEG